MHERIEPHLGQQRNKQEDTCRARSGTQRFLAGEDQFLPIRDCGDCLFLRERDGTTYIDVSKKGDSVDSKPSSPERRNAWTN
jgi:hypothetical protein